MLIKDLNAKHPSYDAETWRDYLALYEGGKRWRERAHRFIDRNPQEPQEAYQQRLKAAHFRSYLGPIVDYFAAFLFTAQMVVKANVNGNAEVPDEWYAEWAKNCDGAGADLKDFVRERFTRALVDQKAYWLVELPEDGGLQPSDRAEWSERGLGAVRLRKVDREQVLDYECDDQGNMLWCIVYEASKPRPDARAGGRGTTLHRWWLYDTTTVEEFQYLQPEHTYLDEMQPAVSLGRRAHGFRRMPMVAMQVPKGLWVANRVESAQKEHAALSNANTWLIRRTCYAMPVFKVRDPERPPVMGTGYYVMIGADEDFEWSAPPAAPFAAISAEVAAQKDEIFRITHQMAIGVDNNAATIGRSAQSKLEDASSTKVVLQAYGAIVREAIERTYQLASEGRGEPYRWTAEGMDKYDTVDAVGLLQSIAQAMLMDIPSPTFGREIRTRAALSLLPDLDETVRDQIRTEIGEGFVTEEQMEPGQPPELPEESNGIAKRVEVQAARR